MPGDSKEDARNGSSVTALSVMAGYVRTMKTPLGRMVSQDERTIHEEILKFALNEEPRCCSRTLFKFFWCLPNPVQAGCLNTLTWPQYDPNVFARKRFIKNQLDREEIQQVVVLGSGYDMRPYLFAKNHPACAVFDVDQAGITRMCKAKYIEEECDAPENLHLVELNLLQENFSEALQQKGFNPALSSIVILEGVSMYLSPEEVRSCLVKLKALIGDNGQIIISFMTSVEQNQLTDCIMRRANERYKSHYELNTLKGLLQELGLNPIMKCTYAGRLEQLRNADDIAEMPDIAHIPQEDYYVLTGHAPIAELDLSRVPEHNLHLMPKPQEQAQRCLVQ